MKPGEGDLCISFCCAVLAAMWAVSNSVDMFIGYLLFVTIGMAHACLVGTGWIFKVATPLPTFMWYYMRMSRVPWVFEGAA